MAMRRLVAVGLVLSLGAYAAFAETTPAPAPLSQSFAAKSVRIDGFAGTLTVQVAPGDISYTLSGPEEETKRVSVALEGETLIIRQSSPDWLDGRTWMWDWSVEAKAQLTLGVPEGTPFRAEGLIGTANVGDLKSPVEIEAIALEGSIGTVTSADIETAGSVSLILGDVSGALDLDITGSGSLKAKSVGAADIDIAGSGSILIDSIASGLTLDIAGAGDVNVGAVQGPVTIKAAGAGDVNIASGEANPLSISLMGAGTVDFGGAAVDPTIEVLGGGSVRIKSYTGKLTSSGGEVSIGQ